MNSFIGKIKVVFQGNDDFFCKKQIICGESVFVIGLDSLVELDKTLGELKEYKAIEEIEQHGEELADIETAEASLLEGKLLLARTNKDLAISLVPAPVSLNRSIESSSNENVVLGSPISFNEDIKLNIGLVRKNMKSQHLKVKTYEIGKQYKKEIALLYNQETVHSELLSKIQGQITKFMHQAELDCIQDAYKMLGLKKWSFVTQINTTETPDEALRAIRKGRVVLFIDRLSLALILPGVLRDMIFLYNDHNYPYPLMLSVRMLRIMGILLALIIPGLYVALVAVNPEVLRIEIALSVAQSREGVPYPAIIEILIMLLILELILEASIRLPNSIGPTITMVGGIILGQAVVEAKLVSNLLIIILAAATIANSTIVGFQNSISIRIFKYLIVFLASLYGILGLLVGLFIICTYLSSIETFGIPYLHFNLNKGEKSSG
ncbi:spore germination protein [Cytobacillus gottheilii]|uniref:Spore germination protein n=1 Tax=Cytobacillus gottheilii TaxID=859144 RepID=A0ABX8FBX8_9BACI|nr:spore germination protein [Cytobacillus gottheilii]QVY61067.1 spore germination protein [Cytobacillus gottheilii]